MKVAMLSPIAWRTPPRSYGPWELIVSLLSEGLIDRGIDVTLFATRDSVTKGHLIAVSPMGYEENQDLLPKVWECLHISELFERGDEFDLIHNHFDYLPLTYQKMTTTPLITTIHGFSSPKIIPVYKKYNNKCYYVSISNADRHPDLDYVATIYHGIDLGQFTFRPEIGDYLLFFGRIHPDKGTWEAIQIALKSNMRLILAGIIQDNYYFEKKIKPFLNDENIQYIGVLDPNQRDYYLGEAYCLLHPINFNEPFGLSVVEAMACGTPVVAFNKGSMQEVINNKKTGFIVNSIENAVSSLNEIKNINRIDCRKWVEKKFSLDRMVEDYIRLYKKILNEN